MIFLTTKQKLLQEVNNAPNGAVITWRDKKYVHGPDFAAETEYDAAVEFCQKVGHSSCLLVDNGSYLSVWIEKKNAIQVPTDKVRLKKDFIVCASAKLAEFIGPIATLVCRNALAQNPTIAKAELIQILAEYIQNPQQASSFKHQLSGC